MLRRSQIFAFCLSDDQQDVSIRPEGPATGHFDTGFLTFLSSNSRHYSYSSCKLLTQPSRYKSIKSAPKVTQLSLQNMHSARNDKIKIPSPSFQVTLLTLLPFCSCTNMIARTSGWSRVSQYEVTKHCLLPKFGISHFASAFHFSPAFPLLL